jgi:hypothetical protein
MGGDWDLNTCPLPALHQPLLSGVEVDKDAALEASKHAGKWRAPVWRHADGSIAEW